MTNIIEFPGNAKKPEEPEVFGQMSEAEAKDAAERFGLTWSEEDQAYFEGDMPVIGKTDDGFTTIFNMVEELTVYDQILEYPGSGATQDKSWVLDLGDNVYDVSFEYKGAEAPEDFAKLRDWGVDFGKHLACNHTWAQAVAVGSNGTYWHYTIAQQGVEVY